LLRIATSVLIWPRPPCSSCNQAVLSGAESHPETRYVKCKRNVAGVLLSVIYTIIVERQVVGGSHSLRIERSVLACGASQSGIWTASRTPLKSRQKRRPRLWRKGSQPFGATNGLLGSPRDSTSSRCRSRTFEHEVKLGILRSG